jgi:hypothetical protein
MIRKFAISFFAVLAMPLSTYAFVGGPFDGNDYGQTLDDRGVYQANFRMKNGTGFAQFGVNVDLVFNPNTTNTGSSTVATNIGGVLDRSLVYLKGISYVGIASGSVDHERGTVTGITNGLSDGTASSGAGATASQVTVVSNGARNFSANSYFNAKIKSKFPLLKFSGKGQITVLAAVSATAQTAIETILTAAAPQQNAATVSATVTATDLAANQAIFLQSTLNYLNAVLPYIAPPVDGGILPDQSYTQPMTVRGSRVFFLSRR